MACMRSVTFLVPPARWAEVVAVAGREGRTPSGLLRYVLDRYLDGPAGQDLRLMADERAERLMGEK